MPAPRRPSFDITFGYEPDPERCIEAVTVLLRWPGPEATAKGVTSRASESRRASQDATSIATREGEAPDRR